MRFCACLFFRILFSSTVFPQIITEHGMVIETDFYKRIPSSNWDGLYGEIILGNQTNHSYTATGNVITELNLFTEDPECADYSIKSSVFAANSSSVSPPLTAGNLTFLDNFAEEEKGSATFSYVSTFELASFTINSVPTLYTYSNGSQSNYFRQGYLNDADGNMIFITNAAADRPNWNGSTSDYQLILPNNGTSTNYTIWIETEYICDDDEKNGEHELYIPHNEVYETTINEEISPNFNIENRGEFPEYDITVEIDCPAEWLCEKHLLERISPGGDEDISSRILPKKEGEYILTVCAKNKRTYFCREFVLIVHPECHKDRDCPEGFYCGQILCKKKKQINEICEKNSECNSNICTNGKCAACKEDNDCILSQTCENSYCREIECSCGYLKNHSCFSYECCLDVDCKGKKICIENTCVARTLEIAIVSGSAIAGEEILVKITDNKGNEIAGAKVFTESQETYTDENGYANIKTPENGLVYASSVDHGQAGILFTVTVRGYFIVPEKLVVGEPEEMQIVDGKGKGIPYAEIIIGNDILVSDKNGNFNYIFKESGKKTLRSAEAGYLVEQIEVMVEQKELSRECKFPYYLNYFSFRESEMHLLWILSIIGSSSVFLTRKKEENKEIKELFYAVVPLILALPNFWLFNICFMSNIIMIRIFARIIEKIKKRSGTYFIPDKIGQNQKKEENN